MPRNEINNILLLFEENQKVFLNKINEQMRGIFKIVKRLISEINLWV